MAMIPTSTITTEITIAVIGLFMKTSEIILLRPCIDFITRIMEYGYKKMASLQASNVIQAQPSLCKIHIG
jgi:hypothetical protein